MNKNGFHSGDYVIYQNGGVYELGRIKRVAEDGAFVWYHDGETASKTPFDCMHKVANEYTIKQTSLGGDARKHGIMSITGNSVNLCDSCALELPKCGTTSDDVIFGDGVGHDNVCACAMYTARGEHE